MVRWPQDHMDGFDGQDHGDQAHGRWKRPKPGRSRQRYT